MDVDFREIRDLIGIYIEVAGLPQNITFILMKFKTLKGWEIALRELLDMQVCMQHVCSSFFKASKQGNSNSAKGENILLPFTVLQLQRISKCEVSVEKLAMNEAAVIKNLLREYMELEGFPEVVFEEGEKERILKEYFEMILFRDIVERHKLRNISLARFLLSFFPHNFSRELSVN